MNLVVCFLFVIYINGIQGGGGGKGSKHDILKIHVPEIIKHQHHTHYVFIHKYEPKKAAKKKEVKHVHHKHIHLPAHGKHHWYSSHAHKHMTKHGHSSEKPAVKVVHKTVHPGAKPHHKSKTAPKKAHDQTTYPFTQENVRYSSGPANHGYQVTEDFDPEVEAGKEFNYDDYSSPTEYSSHQSDGNSNNFGQQYFVPASGRPYGKQFFGSSPSQYSGGDHSGGRFVPSTISSYDISPYHAVQQHQQRPVQADGGGGNSNHEGTSYGSGEGSSFIGNDGSQGEGLHGDYDIDYEPHFDGGFQHGGFDGVSQFGYDPDDFGENVAGYSHHHKKYVNNVNQAVMTTYDDSTNQFSPDGPKKPRTIGFKHTFSQGGQFSSHI